MKLFQINEDDLADLERILPRMAGIIELSAGYGNAEKVLIRQCQRILTDVRWKYGPHSEIEKIPTE